MKRSPRPSRTSVNLSESVHQQLNMYALAASAAGVGMLALAQPSEAKIVYTPAHQIVRDHNSLYGIDLNHDGKADFVLANTNHYTTFEGCLWELWVRHGAGAGNSVMGFQSVNHWWYASALKAGDIIGSGGQFHELVEVMAGALTCEACDFGKWVNVNNRYLGLRFRIYGKTHYGWARLNVAVSGTVITATLTGYAYETIPGKAIIAGKTQGSDEIIEGPDATLTAPSPKPATLGILAIGAPALSIWRWKESVGVAH